MWNYIKNSIWVNILLAVLAVFFGYASYRMIHQAFTATGEVKSSSEEIEELTRKKAELESSIRELAHPEAVVREAKERLNLKRLDESVVIVVPEEKKEGETGLAAGFWENVKELWSKLLGQ